MTTATAAPYVRATAVGVRWPRSGDVLTNLSFVLPRGTFTAVVGRSGCGKSTLLRALAGLVAPTTGTLHVDERVPAAARNAGAGIGMVFQRPALLPWRTVTENVLLAAAVGALDHAAATRRAEDLLARVDLTSFAGAYPHELSGGMQMRVALVRALVSSPRLLLLDEPLAALDTLTREDLQRLLRELHRREGLTTVLVTHDVSEAAFLADRVLLLSPRPGTIVADIAMPFSAERDDSLRRQPAFLEALHTLRERVRRQVA